MALRILQQGSRNFGALQQDRGLQGWLDNTGVASDPCQGWTGVTCNTTSGRVIALWVLNTFQRLPIRAWMAWGTRRKTKEKIWAKSRGRTRREEELLMVSTQWRLYLAFLSIYMFLVQGASKSWDGDSLAAWAVLPCGAADLVCHLPPCS